MPMPEPIVSVRRAARGVLALAVGAILATAAAVPASARQQEEPRYREARRQLVDERIAGARAGGTGVEDERVLAAMLSVPRHRFVAPDLRDEAYRDRPLPIGHGQTISQPSLVAMMTDLLELEPGEKALEIGTGSGYQAAVLAEITDSVYTIEIIEPLADQAARRFRETGYGEVTSRHGDGYFGWPEHAPFDAIVVTAAASHIPPPLIEQLAPGGRMVIPVGPPFRTQQLMLVEKREDGSVVRRGLMPVRFVPFRRADDSGGG